MATASSVSPEQLGTFQEELVELLQANQPHVDLGNLQALYRKHFQKDLSIKKFGISSVKQLVALFGDVVEIVTAGKNQFLKLKSPLPSQSVKKKVKAVKGSTQISQGEKPISITKSEESTRVSQAPVERPQVTDLRKELVELLQNSSEGLIGLHCLSETYKRTYNRNMDLAQYGIVKIKSIADVFSDVLQVVNRCDDPKHRYISNKPRSVDTQRRREKQAHKILKEELEALLKNYPGGIALTSLSKKYTQEYRKNIPKLSSIVESFKDDFEFFNKCSTESHHFLQLKPRVSRAEVVGSSTQSSMAPYGAAREVLNAHPSGFGLAVTGGVSIGGMSLFGAPPTPAPLMSLTPGTPAGNMQQQQQQQHGWGILGEYPMRVQGLPDQQSQVKQQQQQMLQRKETTAVPQEHPTGVFPLLSPPGEEKISKKKSTQLSGITFGTLSASEMLQFLPRDQNPKQAVATKPQQTQQQPLLQLQQPYVQAQLQGQPHKVKATIKLQDVKHSRAASLMDMEDQQPKPSAIRQQQQQQVQKQCPPQPREQQQRYQLQQQLPQQRKGSSVKQQDPKQSSYDAVAQTLIANIAEANELVTVERVVDLLKQQLQVTTLQKLGIYRETQLPSLNQLVRLQSKVNAFIQAFVKVRAICTLHELRESLAMVDAPMGSKEMLDYAALQLGPLSKQPLIYQFFKFPPTKSDADIPKITTSDILEVLNKFLTEKDLWRSRVKLEDFMKYVMEEYDVEGPYDLGLRIQSVGLGIAAIKGAKREQKTTMERARERLKTTMADEVDTAMEKIRKAVMSPADITGHQFNQGLQLEVRRRYVTVTAAEAVNMVFNNASKLTDYSRNLRQFWLSLTNVMSDRLSRSLFQLAICSGDLSRPDDIPAGILDSEDEDEDEEDSGPDEETSPVKSQPTEDQVREELLRYLDRLQHGALNLKDLARIEAKLCQHFGFQDFMSLSRAKRTFLQFLSLDHPGVLESVGGTLMGLASGSPCQGSMYRPSRLDLVEFIRQCDPSKESLDAVDICLCSHYQVSSVEELGHGPIHRLSQHIIKMASRLEHQHEHNPVIYETALCASNRRNESKQKKVGLFGSQSLESALGCLASAPLLEDLAEWSHWSMVFQPEHGILKAFLERSPGQGLSPPIEINALEVKPGVLLQLATETSPDLFAAAAKRGDSVGTVGHLVSLVAKDGLSNTPLALLSNHMETALSMLDVDSDEAVMRHSTVICFVLNCLIAVPLFIGQSVVRQVILNPLTTVLGSEVKSRQLILKACQTTAQRTKIQSLGLLLGISQWKDSFIEDRMPRNMDKEEDEEDFSVDEEEFDFNNLLTMSKASKSSKEALEVEEGTTPAEDSSADMPPSQEVEMVGEPLQTALGRDEQNEDTSEVLQEEEIDEDPNDISEARGQDQSSEGQDEKEDIGDSKNEGDEMLPLDESLDSLPTTEESSKTDEDDDLQPTVDLTPFQQSVLDCKEVIQSIRREEFGVGMEMDEKTQRLMDRQQERIGRSLKRLSEELYSKDTHFVLELIQNADDNEYEEGVEPSLVFVVDRSEVRVLNNEQGFSESNIRALCDVGRSTKGKHKRGYIGHKGIGFKSVFRVTDKPEITSKGYHVCFDRSVDQMGYILPTWVGPDEIQDIAEMEEPPKPWTTQISLPLKGDTQRTTSLVNKFEDIQPSLLLFLNRLRSIAIKNKEENTTSHMTRKDKGGSVVEIRYSKNTDSWLLVKKCLDATKLQRLQIESTELGLAFPLSEGMSTEQNVFAFLPLRSYGFHFIIQGDFDIPSSREDIDADSAWNQWLLQEIAPLFVDALENFKTHYHGDPIRAVCQFLKFVPLDSQILTNFFRKVAVNIHKRLKATPCMPVLTTHGEDEVAWKLPSETIMCPDRLVREVVPSDALKAHLNCSYLHHRVVGSISDVLLKSLGVKVLQTGELMNILSSVALAAKQSGESLTPKIVAQWLTCVYRSRDKYDVSQGTLDRLQSIPIIPLSSGQVVTLEESSVFFPISEEDETDQLHGQIASAFSKPLQALNEDMSTLDGRVLTSLDKVANSQVLQLLEELGVRHISPRDVIRHHILPVIQSDKWKDKSRDVMVGYMVYIKEQLARQSDVCDLDKVADCIHVVTNHGLIKPRERPVHFTVTYGNNIDLSEILPGCDWVLLDSCYIFHNGPHRLDVNEVRLWHTFFSKLGVLNFLAVEKKLVTVKAEELDVTPWADLGRFWEKPADGVYKIVDNVCKEFEELVLADLQVSTMRNQRHNLLHLLQLEWNRKYADYTGAVVFDQSDVKLSSTESSFAINLKTKAWLPSTPVRGESEGDVVFRSPSDSDIFISEDKTKQLLNDHVPYLCGSVQREGIQMLQFLGLKTVGDINVNYMISKLKSWCCDEGQSPDLTASTSFCTSLRHIIRVYQFLAQNCRPQELEELFGDHRVMFVPVRSRPPNIEESVKGQFVHKSMVYWRDPSNLLQRYDGLSDRAQLCVSYPLDMQNFFQRINIDAMPTIKEYAQVLVHCVSDITLPGNDRIKGEVLVLYGILGYKCLSSSSNSYGQLLDQPAQSSAQHRPDVNSASAEYVKRVLEEQPVFPTLGNKWVTLKDKPLICDRSSSDLQKLFSDKKEVHLLNFGDRDRLGRVVESRSLPANVQIFLEVCGIEMLADCIKEEFITELSKPSLQLQLFLHEVSPYIQLYMSTHQNTKKEIQSAYEKLQAEVNITAKLKVMRFMTATTIEKVYRFKYDTTVFAKESVVCGLSELTEFYIATSISQNLRQNSSVRREVAKLFSCGSAEVQEALFSFLGSLLLELGLKRKAVANNTGVDEGICRALRLTFPLESDKPWEVPKPFIPEEVVVKPVKVKPVTEPMLQPAAGSQMEDEDDGAIHSWPPKSGTYGPQKSTKAGGQPKSEDAVLKMWPPPQPLVNSPASLFLPPPGPPQPTLRQPLQPGDGARLEGATDTPMAPRYQRSQDGVVVHSLGANGEGVLPYPPGKVIGQGGIREGTGLPYLNLPSTVGPLQLNPSQAQEGGYAPEESPSAPTEMVEADEEVKESSTSEEEPDAGSSEESGEEEEDEDNDDEEGGTVSPETFSGQFHTPPQVQRLAALSHPSSSSVKKFFVPPQIDGETMEVEFEDLAHSPALLDSLEDVSLPLGDNLDTTDIARWGENLVYLYLIQEAKNMASEGSEVEVHWVNQQDESGEPYDIVVKCGSACVYYVEVKSTIKDQKHVVEISPKEVAFAQEMGQAFHLYRVFNVGNARAVRLCRLRDLALRMDRKEVKLFMYL